ncbi:hypothetical protein M0804_007971 [Polistes exclamans]|nr:hypothetical protein M0804_007971 [Polistes exclamans]
MTVHVQRVTLALRVNEIQPVKSTSLASDIIPSMEINCNVSCRCQSEQRAHFYKVPWSVKCPIFLLYYD